MNRTVRLAIVALGAAVILLAVWITQRLAHQRTPSSSFGRAFQTALTNPVEFAKRSVTGDTGLLLRLEPGTGRILVQGVGVGSPAEAAGLRAGDLLVDINDQSVTNQSLRQVVDTLRGFTGGRVEVTVQRAGVTNLTCIVRRTSWNTLLNTTFNHGQGTNK